MNSRNIILAGLLALSLAVPGFLFAGNEPAALEKPSISARQTVKIVTRVEAIDYETKLVTLKGPEGNLKTIKAEKTPNLEEVEVGDQVNIEYTQNLSIEVVDGQGAQPGQGVMSASAVNTPDESPGGMEMTTTVTTATVEEIDLETNTFKLKLPSGEIQGFEAVNPENLKAASVGDLVVATHTEAVAIYLVELPTE